MLAGSLSLTADKALSIAAGSVSQESRAQPQDLGEGDLPGPQAVDVVEDDGRDEIGQVVADLAQLAELGPGNHGHPAARSGPGGT